MNKFAVGNLLVSVLFSAGCSSSQSGNNYSEWNTKNQKLKQDQIQISQAQRTANVNEVRSDIRTRAQLLEDAYRRGLADALEARNKSVMADGFPYRYWQAPIRQRVQVPFWRYDEEAGIMFPPHERDVVVDYGRYVKDVGPQALLSDHFINVDQVWQRPEGDYEDWAKKGEIRPYYETERNDGPEYSKINKQKRTDPEAPKTRRYNEDEAVAK